MWIMRVSDARSMLSRSSEVLGNFPKQYENHTLNTLALLVQLPE